MYIIVTQSDRLANMARKIGEQVFETHENITNKSIDTEKSLDALLTDFLKSLDIPTHLKGFMYLKYIIKYALENPGFDRKPITRIVYPVCAKEFNTATANIERAIRHAIVSGYKVNVNSDKYIKIFGNLRKAPTNDQFFTAVVLYYRENLYNN